MSFLISDAWAQAGGEGGSGLLSLAPLVIIFVLFYFLLIRPQQKRAKQHKEMVASIKKGDDVATNGGLLGRVIDLDDNFVTLEIAKGYLFINGIWPRVVSQRDLKPLRLLGDAVRGEDPIVDGAMACLHAQVQRRSFQEPYLRELRRKVDMPAIEIPFLFTREFARDAITVLSDHILKEIERVEAKRRRA